MAHAVPDPPMLTLLRPHLQLDSVYELSPGRLHSLGLDGLLLDLDGTLKDYHARVFPEATVAWVRTVREARVRLCLLSNGRSARIAPLAQSLDLPFVAEAYKPLPFHCRRAQTQLGLPAERVGLVGDQVFADVLAGRLAGLFTILVRPTSPEEPWFTRLKRPVERRLLRWLNDPVQGCALSFDRRDLDHAAPADR
jgi:HAD superfamily phosphatase (TIGR01668 family)